MMPPLFFYQLALLGLLWLCVMLHLAWPSRGPVSSRRSVEPETSVKPRRKRSNAPKPFVGLTHKPPCVLCIHEASHPPSPPPRPDPMSPTTRRPRQVDTSKHFCPHATCDYRGWLGLGNLRANGHPNGGPWRQFHCTPCDGYFPEHCSGSLSIRDSNARTMQRANGLPTPAFSRLSGVAQWGNCPRIVDAQRQ
jgi:hypothetical protein